MRRFMTIFGFGVAVVISFVMAEMISFQVIPVQEEQVHGQMADQEMLVCKMTYLTTEQSWLSDKFKPTKWRRVSFEEFVARKTNTVEVQKIVYVMSYPEKSTFLGHIQNYGDFYAQAPRDMWDCMGPSIAL